MAELHFYGNYFDLGPDPEGVLNTLINLDKKRNCVFYQAEHEENLLLMLGIISERPDFRVHWISPYLGTPYTIEKMGLDPWISYGQSGPINLKNSKWAQEAVDFIKNLNKCSAALYFKNKNLENITELLNERSCLRVLLFTEAGFSEVVSQKKEHDFFSTELILWVQKYLEN
ncbi:MAG: hypothetical protein WA160_05520 [Pseudobdellovibrio sp.]